MTVQGPTPGAYMRAEIAEAPGVFAATVRDAVDAPRRAGVEAMRVDQARAMV
jgi:hypothetical protein